MGRQRRQVPQSWFPVALASQAGAFGFAKSEGKGTNNEGDWPNDVKVKNLSDTLWPTEESISNIIIYSESEESEYNSTKKEKVIPLLNKIMILQKEGEIEYVVDRFISY